MKKLQTQNQLQDYLDKEFGWRLKEIAALKMAVKTSSFISERTLIRASVALVYAHWEGFVKSAATAYVTYVNLQRLNYDQLQTCFVVLGLKKTLSDFKDSKKSHLNINLVEFIRDNLGSKSQLNIDTAINTGSNLKSSTFENILHTVGIDPAPYETKANFIDESLLKRRNTIAHGEFIDITKDDWDKLADEVIQMLRHFKNDIENSMVQSSFKRKTAA